MNIYIYIYIYIYTGYICQDASLPCRSDTRISDPQNCNKYYECGEIYGDQGRRWIQRPCGPATVFDVDLRMCGHTYEVRCDEPRRGWCELATTQLTRSSSEKANTVTGKHYPFPCDLFPPPSLSLSLFIYTFISINQSIYLSIYMYVRMSVCMCV